MKALNDSDVSCSFPGLVSAFTTHLDPDHSNYRVASITMCCAFVNARIIGILEIQKGSIPQKVSWKRRQLRMDNGTCHDFSPANICRSFVLAPLNLGTCCHKITVKPAGHPQTLSI